MLLVELIGKAFLSSIVEKGTDVGLVASRAITFNALILVGVIETLDCSMALVAFEATLAVVPTYAVLQCLTVFRGVLEKIWRSSKIPCVVRVEAAL